VWDTADVVRIVVMGVASSGKSTMGARLAARLGTSFVDGDTLHPSDNVDKMSAGVPLDDADREPWLERIRDTLAANDSIVVACSALRRRYRDVIRGAGEVRFVFLDLDEDAARRRAAQRKGHFMGAEMVASQFGTLERPAPDESDVVTIDVSRPHEVVLAEIVERVVERRSIRRGRHAGWNVRSGWGRRRGARC
jgi:gluconokinase